MKRFFAIPFILALMLGLIFVLPHRGDVAPTSLSRSAIDMETKTPPLHFGDWLASATEASENEVKTLNADTTFIKANYRSYDLPPLFNQDGQQLDSFISLSIVISGFDINNSIHRPERCLRAQGHLEMQSLADDFSTPAGRAIKVQRLTSIYPMAPKQEGGKPFPIGFISYYYFVGHKNLTHDHYARTFLDMRDRLLHGADQQWSFVMLSMPYHLGETPAQNSMNQKRADKKIRQLLGELTDLIVDWDQLK